MKYTDEELQKMTKEDAINNFGEDVYVGARLIERLEEVGKIMGSGHHIRQKIGAFAEKVMREYWIDEPVGNCSGICPECLGANPCTSK